MGIAAMAAHMPLRGARLPSGAPVRYRLQERGLDRSAQAGHLAELSLSACLAGGMVVENPFSVFLHEGVGGIERAERHALAVDDRV